MDRKTKSCWPVEVAALIIWAILTTPFANACMGSPPPLCGRTLAFSTSAPDTVLAAGGAAVAVAVPALAFFNVIEAPAGACPPPGGDAETASLSVDVDVDCTGPNDGSGSLTATPIGSQFTNVDLAVSLDPGPPRICDITSTASALMPDGTTLTATSSNNVCVGEPAPGNPTLPRLDLERLGDSINVVHPGDQTSFSYRITNNDPTESFSGKLAVELRNTSRLPQQNPSPADPLDDGPYAVSAPLLGDNFPIGFTEDLVNSCLYIPLEHEDPSPSTLSKLINLGPGESAEVDIFARPFGGCADGSCGGAKVFIEGLYTDQSAGFACSGFVAAADTSVAPQYAWAGAGAVLSNATTPAPFVVLFDAFPDPDETYQLVLNEFLPEIAIDGEMIAEESVPESFPYDGELGRIIETFGVLGTPLAPGGVNFTYSDVISVEPFDLSQQIDFLITNFRPSTPVGLEISAGGYIIEVAAIPLFQFDIEFFVDVVYELSGSVTYAGGEQLPVQIDSFDVGPGPTPRSFLVSVSGTIPDAGGANVEVFKAVNDFRGFARDVSDYDQDSVNDHLDNCILVANFDQRDSNGDGFGNVCDADLNNDGIVNAQDLGIMKSVFFTGDLDGDLNGDDIVNVQDLGILKTQFFNPPGPSGM